MQRMIVVPHSPQKDASGAAATVLLQHGLGSADPGMQPPSGPEAVAASDAKLRLGSVGATALRALDRA
ncbi:MAG: hypothetical protein AAF913_17915, partial [Pseudomonadota bacterium]